MKDTSQTYTHRGYTIRGWYNDNKRQYHTKIASNIKNGTIVEVGVYGGASILSIVDESKLNNNTIYAIDPWELVELSNGVEIEDLYGWQTMMKGHRETLEKIVSELDYGHVNIIKDFSINAVNMFEDKSIDMVYIDADHSYEMTKQDMNIWYPKIKIGGVLSGDDYGWSGVEKAVVEFVEKLNTETPNSCIPIINKDTWQIKVQ
jgi:predicted O-methyltransferase YrrM